MLHTFHGGIRPAGRKEATRRSGIQPLEPGPARVALPLAWCGGAAELLVQPGDTVGLGQVLARPEGEGIPLRASVSGTVAAVERRAFPGGRPLPARMRPLFHVPMRPDSWRFLGGAGGRTFPD